VEGVCPTLLLTGEDRREGTALDECHDAMIVADAVEMGGISLCDAVIKVNPLSSATLSLRSRVTLLSSSHRTIGMNTLTGKLRRTCGRMSWLMCLGHEFLSIRGHLRILAVTPRSILS